MERKIIDASKNSLFPDIKELFRYKDLFITLAWRDFRVRYAQTTIGFLWAILQPIVTLLIITLVFNQFAGIETEVPFIVFAVCGLSMWTYFAYVMTNSGNSIIQSQDMVKKIYFPRLIIPFSKAVVGLIDFGITIVILIVLMIYFQVPVSENIIFAPVFMLFGMLSALGVGIWLSALTVRYRDFQHIVPFMVQIGLYLTPVAYPIELVSNRLPKWAESIYYLNPMAGVIQGFRWSILGGEAPSSVMFVSFGMIVLLFISGLIYFKKIEGDMADFI